MEAFKFLWRRDDHKKVASIPARGIPGTVKELIYLMADSRICRETVGIELTQWTEMMALQSWQQVLANGVQPTPEDVKKNFDKLVNYLTSDYYKKAVPGETTVAYFEDAKNTRKAMDKVFKNGQMFLPSDLSPNF